MPLSKQQFAQMLAHMPANASDDQVKQAADQHEAGTPLQKIWSTVNRPLVGSKDALIPGLRHEHGDEESTVRKVLEDLGASLTSPISLGTAALGAGGAIAGAKGALGISKAARLGEAALQAPFVAEGVHKVATGDSAGEKLGGALEAGLGAYGVKSAASHAFPVKKVADTYVKEAGLRPLETKASTYDPARAIKIADAYEAMPHNPGDPQTAKSYGALGKEVEDQYNFLTKRAGVKIEPWHNEGQPYKSSADMVADVEKNNHLYYFPSEAGFGAESGAGSAAENPLLAKGKNDIVLNDQFRAVHDYFGHAKSKNQFGPKGEEAAWNGHSQMFSREARPAMTTETRGQNSWVNSGPHLRDETGALRRKGEPGWVPPQERPFAPQKTGLLPAEMSGTAIQPQGDELADVATRHTAATAADGNLKASQIEFSPETYQQIKLTHQANGGSTTDLKTSRALTPQDARYILSPYEDRQMILDRPPTEQDIKNFIAKNEDLLVKPGHNLGTWDNQGKHYLDVSIGKNDPQKAIQLGREHKQLAIYDLAEGKDIPIDAQSASNVEAIPRTETPSALNPATVSAVGAPIAAATIDDSDPNDPHREFKRYGKLALNILGAASAGGALAAGIRVNPQSAQKAAATKGAAMLLLGGGKREWMKKMALEVHPSELPKVRAAAEKILSTQLVKAEGQMPNAKKLFEHFAAGQAEAGWYDDVHKELKELFGEDASMMAQLLAATSSNATVKSNVTLALKAYAQVKAGEPITAGYLPAVVQQINRVAKGEGLEGRKIDNFAKAILGDENAVVVDRWMMRAFGFTKDAPTPHEYDVIEHAVKELAARQKVTPRQMQASIWFSVKNKAEAEAGRVNPAPPYGQLLRDKMAQQKLPL